METRSDKTTGAQLANEPPATLTISLVICTRNRAAQMGVAFESLLTLPDQDSFELVIVNNGSTDDTEAVIESYRSRFSHFVSVFEPVAGLGRARNRGWRAASGDIIAFIDDDCYPAKDHLKSICLCFEEDDQIGFVGGRILLYDETDYRITIQERSTRRVIKPGAFISAGFIQGANLACRRVALEEVGGFDVLFGHGAQFPCEDVDVQARISAHGWRGLYDPRPLVYHHHGRKTHEEAMSLMKQYDRGRGAYYAKCILNSKLRSTYAKRWIKKILRQPFQRTWRELLAGGEYIGRLIFTKSTRPTADSAMAGPDQVVQTINREDYPNS